MWFYLWIHVKIYFDQLSKAGKRVQVAPVKQSVPNGGPTPINVTGKSLSKALFLYQLNQNMTKDCSWNYHKNCKRRTWARHGQNMFCACSFHSNSMNNLLSYFGLVDARISAFEKDLPVFKTRTSVQQ